MCVLCVNVFPPCLQVCVVPKFLSLDFEMPPETLVFLKTGIKVQFNALAAGRRPEFEPKFEIFIGGCALCWFQGSLVFWAHFQVFVHLWSLKKVAEVNFGFKTVEICKHGWMLSNLSVIFFAFSWRGTFSEIQFIFANFLSERFVCHICLHMHFDVFWG